MSYFLSLDIETGGPWKPIFAIGAAVFTINDSTATFTGDELRLSMNVTPGDTTYFDDDTWQRFWSKAENLATLGALNAKANCLNECDLIKQFYETWVQWTVKYPGIRIVTDNPPFDVGRMDACIEKYSPVGIKSLPLTKQWKNAELTEHDYVSTIDYNTFELLYETTFPKTAYSKMDEIIGTNPYPYSHDPLDDCKRQAYNFAKLWTHFTRLI